MSEYEREQDGAIPPSRMVSFGASLGLYFRNYFSFNGRSSRGAYWWATLWLFLLGIATIILDMVLFPTMVASEMDVAPLNSLLSLGTFVPSLSLWVRRLHDVGRSGWWILAMFTIIGLIPLIWWSVQPGQRRENSFGPDHEAGR